MIAVFVCASGESRRPSWKSQGSRAPVIPCHFGYHGNYEKEKLEQSELRRVESGCGVDGSSVSGDAACDRAAAFERCLQHSKAIKMLDLFPQAE